MRKHLILALALTFTLTSTALADDEEDYTANPSTRGGAGIGGMGGKSGDAREGAFVIETHYHGSQERSGTFGTTLYGNGEFRLEIGSGFGIEGSGKSGAQVFGAELTRDAETGEKDTADLMLHGGLEPWNTSFSFNTDDAREDYFEWQPMASIGAQLKVDTMSVIALVRGGASLGWLGTTSAHASGAYGAGLYLTSPSFQLSGEATRTDGPATVDVFTADAHLKLGQSRIGLGVHAEAIVTREKGDSVFLASSPTSEDHVEARILGTIGGALPAL